MQQDRETEEEQIWWARYIYKRDLGALPQIVPQQGNAFFYARDEAEARKQVAGWQHSIKHEAVIVYALEQVTADFKLELRLGPLPEWRDRECRADGSTARARSRAHTGMVAGETVSRKRE